MAELFSDEGAKVIALDREALTYQKENVLCISKQALYQADGKYYVYMPDEAGLKQVRFIEIGLIGDTYVEVVSGITEGEKVIRK